MVFINPWAYYQINEPDKIPDLNPHDDEEMVGCLAGACGAIIASVIYVLIFYLCFTLTDGILRPILVTIDSVVIYPIIMICLMELSFKIADKFTTNKKKEIIVMEGLIELSGRICDFELISRKDLKERGYKYMEKISGIFYKENEVDFDILKDENFTEVKLTFNDGKEIKLDGADIDSIVTTHKRTFTIYMYKNLIPKVYENVIKIEIK